MPRFPVSMDILKLLLQHVFKNLSSCHLDPIHNKHNHHTQKQPSPEHTRANKLDMADTEKAERERIFKRFDANGDGQISSTELGDALKTLSSVTPDDITRMMKEIDTDGDGLISYEEFDRFATANPALMKDAAKIF
ncbi:hypothetical protein PTKIN_Ptkin12aG0038500 [Pterospermum kingtungense]